MLRPLAALVTATAALGACAGASAPSAAAAVATTAPTATTAPADLAEPRCGAQRGLVATSRGPATARWGGSTVWAGEAPLAIRLCGPGRATVTRVEVGEPVRWRVEYEPGLAVVGDGAPVVVTVAGTTRPSIAPVRVTAVDGEGHALTAVAPLESVDDPDRATARAACDACRGTWGPHGMLGLESCDCPTPDAGRPCLAGADCVGICLATGWERVTDEPDAGCRTGQARMRLVGRCSARTSNFGCHAEVREPTIACQWTDGPWSLPTVCSD